MRRARIEIVKSVTVRGRLGKDPRTWKRIPDYQVVVCGIGSEGGNVRVDKIHRRVGGARFEAKRIAEELRAKDYKVALVLTPISAERACARR